MAIIILKWPEKNVHFKPSEKRSDLYRIEVVEEEDEEDESNVEETRFGATESRQAAATSKQLRPVPDKCELSAARKRDRLVIAKLGLIVIMFLVSWIPFCIVWPLISIFQDSVPESFYTGSFWLAYLNSLCIYLYNNSKQNEN